MISDVKNLLFLLTNFKFQELAIMYRVHMTYLYNLIIVSKIFETLHVLVVLESQNLLEIR